MMTASEAAVATLSHSLVWGLLTGCWAGIFERWISGVAGHCPVYDIFGLGAGVAGGGCAGSLSQ